MKKIIKNIINNIKTKNTNNIESIPYCKYTNFEIVFDVDLFNKWFKKPKPDKYTNIGIFGRVDKLSDEFFYEYFESYIDIHNGSMFAYSYDPIKFVKFKDMVKKDWLEKNKI